MRFLLQYRLTLTGDRLSYGLSFFLFVIHNFDAGDLMKKRLLYAVAIAVSLAMISVSSADYSDSSADSGTFDDLVPFSSTIVVPVNEIVTNVGVTINMEHSWVGDVTATLTDPTGNVIELIPTALSDSSNMGFDSGGDVLSPALYTWSDLGATTIGTAAAGGGSDFEIPPGTYLPSDGTATGAGSMATTFGGFTTLGNWTIDLSDSAGGDDGNVDGWSIDIKSFVVPEPSSLALLGMTGLACVIRRRR